MKRKDLAADFQPCPPEIALIWLLRIVALYCLLFGVFYWVKLIGYYPGLTWRFDLMPVHWRIAAASLAVLYPFAAIGLWLLASWGPVIWFVCAAIEVAMYGYFSTLYGERLLFIYVQFAIALAYTGLRVAIWQCKRKAAR